MTNVKFCGHRKGDDFDYENFIYDGDFLFRPRESGKELACHLQISDFASLNTLCLGNYGNTLLPDREPHTWFTHKQIRNNRWLRAHFVTKFWT